MSWFFGPEDPGWELLPCELRTPVHIAYLKRPAKAELIEDEEPLVIKYFDDAGNEWLL